jgi:hypothetical protein
MPTLPLYRSTPPPQPPASEPPHLFHGGPVLDVTVVELRFRVEDLMNLPRHPGSTLRGVLGHALQALDPAVYDALWEAPPRRPGLPQRYNDPPRAYILEPRLLDGKRAFIAGEEVTLRVKLVGRARDWLPQLILAAAQMGLRGVGAGRGEMNLRRAEVIDRLGVPTRIYEEDRGLLDAGDLPRWTLDLSQPPPEGEPRRLRLELETPLYLKTQGKPLRAFDPATFTARLIDRLDLLALFHHDVETTWDFRALRALADAVRVLHDGTHMDHYERYSNRIDQRVEMQGLVGEVILEGVHPALEALWRSAEVVHVGKNATFGLGRLRVTPAGA